MNDVTHTITDGLMGFNSTSAEGIHIKIGASPIEGDPVIITSRRKLEYIREKLGLSPLADAVMDSIENGADKIICLPVKPDVSGAVSEVTAEKQETSGTLSVSGKPNNSFSVIVIITGKGALNEAVFKYSINSGYTYSDELSVPLAGSYEIPETGLTVGFSLTDGQEYAVNDKFTFTTTAPQLSNENVISGIEKIKEIKQEAEFVHIVGSCTPDTWAAVSALQDKLQKESHKPLFFILEAFEKKKDQDMKGYVEELEAARKKVKNFDLQVVAARAMYAGMDNIVRDVNFAGIICGLYAQVAVNKSIGETAVISISEDKIVQLLPEGITDEHIDELDQLGYLTMRQYDGLSGYYVNNAKMMGAEGTDYRYAEDVRVVNKIIRETRKTALLQLQSDIDLENPMADLQAKVQFIREPLDKMIENKEISSAEVIVPEDAAETILKDEKLVLHVRYGQRGIIRTIVIDVGKKNPYAK